MDDFEKFIRHSDFGKVLDLAGKLKEQKSRLVTFAEHDGLQDSDSPPSMPLQTKKKKKKKKTEVLSNRAEKWLDPPLHDAALEDAWRDNRPAGRRRPAAFESAADLIRATLILAEDGDDLAASSMKDITPPRMGRGECVITDSLIDETIKSLAEELRFYMDLKRQARDMPAMQLICRTKSRDDTDERTNQVAVKFTKWQTDILTEWMIDHRVSLLHEYIVICC